MSTHSTPLPRSTPEAEGIDSRAILAFLKATKAARLELHSFMLVRHGKVVAEGWWHPYAAEMNHSLFSLSKSFTSTAIGLAVDEGLLTVDDKVITFFPDEVPDSPNEHLQAMTVRHLLSMNTGHALEPTWHMLGKASTWTQGFFDIPIEGTPGEHFLYNTGATYMLAAILHKLTGQTLVGYLTPRLFAPLGIKNPTWEMSPQGINTGGFGLSITTEDIARFGQLYLQKGVWQGKQIVPAAWVAEATQLTSVNGFASAGGDWAQGYGYQFWRGQAPGSYRGDGAFGQYCFVLPEQDAVLAMTSAVAEMQPPLDLFYAHILPAMVDGSLPPDASAHGELVDQLASLAHAPATGESSTEYSEAALNATYILDANDFGIESVRLEAEGEGTVLVLNTTRGIERIPVGFGVWADGCTRTYNGPPLFASTPTKASGAWIAPDSWRAIIRVVETPFYATVGLRFVGDKVVFTNRLNVSMAPNSIPDMVGTHI